jgi:hypothetical protein
MTSRSEEAVVKEVAITLPVILVFHLIIKATLVEFEKAIWRSFLLHLSAVSSSFVLRVLHVSSCVFMNPFSVSSCGLRNPFSVSSCVFPYLLSASFCILLCLFVPPFCITLCRSVCYVNCQRPLFARWSFHTTFAILVEPSTLGE